jgi:hypothetical protein
MKSRLCSETDCYNNVAEDDIERDAKTGAVYILSLKCWDCRTPQDRKKIKAWRKRHRTKTI